MKLAGFNIVIAASQFNPSIISQLWLVRNSIVLEQDFLSGSFYTEHVVNIQARGFHLFVIPEQLQFVPNGSPEEAANLITGKLGSIVNALPHTPYRAIGLNFLWVLQSDEDGDVIKLGRELFFKSSKPLYQKFASDNARFGGYLSRDVLGCRMKLDIKPVSPPEQALGGVLPLAGNTLQFAFNFNLDLVGEKPIDDINRMLGLWSQARDEAQKTVEAALR